MAPSTALSSMLLGCATFFIARVPASRPGHRAGLAIGSAVALVALMFFILSYQGILLDAEHLGFSAALTVEGARIGHMSPTTAFCLLFGGLSLVALLYSTPDRRWPAIAALLLAGPILFVSAIFLLGYLFGMPLLYGGPFILKTVVNRSRSADFRAAGEPPVAQYRRGHA